MSSNNDLKTSFQAVMTLKTKERVTTARSTTMPKDVNVKCGRIIIIMRLRAMYAETLVESAISPGAL